MDRDRAAPRVGFSDPSRQFLRETGSCLSSSTIFTGPSCTPSTAGMSVLEVIAVILWGRPACERIFKSSAPLVTVASVTATTPRSASQPTDTGQIGHSGRKTVTEPAVEAVEHAGRSSRAVDEDARRPFGGNLREHRLEAGESSTQYIPVRSWMRTGPDSHLVEQEAIEGPTRRQVVPDAADPPFRAAQPASLEDRSEAPSGQERIGGAVGRVPRRGLRHQVDVVIDQTPEEWGGPRDRRRVRSVLPGSRDRPHDRRMTAMSTSVSGRGGGPSQEPGRHYS